MRDIATRLRAVLHNDRSVELMTREAADEIDRKNLTIKALTEERDEVVRMANKLIAERDEARRRLCSELLEVEGHPFGWKGASGAKGIAERLGWDCFKEKP